METMINVSNGLVEMINTLIGTPIWLSWIIFIIAAIVIGGCAIVMAVYALIKAIPLFLFFGSTIGMITLVIVAAILFNWLSTLPTLPMFETDPPKAEEVHDDEIPNALPISK